MTELLRLFTKVEKGPLLGMIWRSGCLNQDIFRIKFFCFSLIEKE
jgi:hypothetical protein